MNRATLVREWRDEGNRCSCDNPFHHTPPNFVPVRVQVHAFGRWPPNETVLKILSKYSYVHSWAIISKQALLKCCHPTHYWTCSKCHDLIVEMCLFLSQRILCRHVCKFWPMSVLAFPSVLFSPTQHCQNFLSVQGEDIVLANLESANSTKVEQEIYCTSSAYYKVICFVA